ncbi:hypothetical protein DPMN_040428 [Dreissena polymorpha]|uniref:Uncharacterized protein n=1 Tax=Dreissena polymorpha TaxID=45954 RepID=A0A9D4HV70_DREPO|nr:hypothetical protein DPMN_040428 [Dreissena polymorpha]
MFVLPTPMAQPLVFALSSQMALLTALNPFPDRLLSDLPLQANTSPAVLITVTPYTADKPDYTISIGLLGK